MREKSGACLSGEKFWSMSSVVERDEQQGETENNQPRK